MSHFRQSSYLLCTIQNLLQQQAAVKLHRDYSSHWKSLAYSPERKFARFQSGTVKTSFDLHAGRRLIGKGLRYLKTVRVTAAVYEGLNRLEPVLTHSHWAGFTDYTNPFGLAVRYVFIKQSGFPCNWDLFFNKENRHGLYQRYATNLPNSLDWIILSHLRLLSVGTCFPNLL